MIDCGLPRRLKERGVARKRKTKGKVVWKERQGHRGFQKFLLGVVVVNVGETGDTVDPDALEIGGSVDTPPHV